MNNKDTYRQHGYTKHYYVEADRIASKIGGGMSHSGNDFGEHIYEFDISTQNDYGRKSEENAKTMYNHLDSAQSNVGSQFEVLLDVDYRIIRKFTETDEEERHIFYFHKDHLGSSTQISDMGQNVIHHIEYMPTGEQFLEQRDYWHTPFKFNGKELDEETGLYYYGARYYTPEVGIWLSVDPLSDKYPSMSAFMYCAGNPVVLVDPDGREIWIVGADGVETLYTPGMEYKGDKFTSSIVNSLNQMNSVDIGGEVLGDLVNSSNKFSITNEKSAEGTAGIKENSSGGAKIYMNGNTGLAEVAHELFHGYQHEHGQGGKSIHNEVEAYAYSIGVTTSYARMNNMCFGGSFLNSRNSSSINGSKYSKAAINLVFGDAFSQSDFNTAVKFFKSESGANDSGIYNNCPQRLSNQKQSLLSRFYPLW